MRLFVGLLIITTAISLYFILLKSRIFGRLDSYAISHMEVFSPHEFLTGVILNATRYWSLLLADWSGTALGWIVLALSIVAGICLILPNPGRSGNCSFTGRVSALLFLGALTLLSMGHLLIKHDPSFVPRWFVGAGVMLSLFNLILLGRVGMDGVNAVIRFAGQGLVLLLAYSIILVAFSYGQARSAQKDFEAALLTRLVGDVTPMLNDRKVSEVTIVGMMPRSPILAQTVRKFPALDRIVVRNFRDDYIFGQLQLMHYGVNLKYAKQTNTLLKQLESNDNIFVDKFLYELHVIGRTLIIVFPSDQATVSNS